MVSKGLVIIDKWSSIGSRLTGRSQKMEIKTNSAFLLRYRVTKFTKLSLVKGRTFANPEAHPYPNYMSVPPGTFS